MTKEILDIVSRLQDFYSNPFIYLPFRLPSLEEKARDSELYDLIQQTIQDASPPIRTLHNIIGNFFKPSAVLAALGGATNIQNLVAGNSSPNLWCPASPQRVEANFTELRTRVINDISGQPQLQQHVAQRWFPKHVPRVDSDDFWYTSKFFPTPQVNTTPSAPLPPPTIHSPSTPVFPISTVALNLLTQHLGVSELLQACVFHSYPLDILLGNSIPPFTNVTLPIFLTPALLQKPCFVQAYFAGWELYQNKDAVLVLTESSNGCTLSAYGNFDSFFRLYLFVFASASPTFNYTILIQHVTPPLSLQPTLLQLHPSWTLPPHLQIYLGLLRMYPTLVLFDSLPSSSMDQPSILPTLGPKIGSSTAFILLIHNLGRFTFWIRIRHSYVGP